MICDNIATVKGKIRQAARKIGRNPDDITLVCVTKNRSLEEIREALACGAVDMGENKVQEAKEKQREMDARFRGHDNGVGCLSQVRWHMVGHLQTNKARDAVMMFDLIHSVDSFKLAGEINKQAARINKAQDILIEVNTSGEASKYGVKPEDLIKLVKEIINLKNMKLSGLMTIAPIVKNREEARKYFRKLRELRDEVNKITILDRRGMPSLLRGQDCSVYGGVGKPRLSKFCDPLSTLSMGMSQDYEVAVEEGATMVRVGSAIFGV